MKLKNMLKMSVALPIMAAATPVVAQDAEDDIVGLEEIIVTARKKEENMQAAPVSITALTAAAIERNNLTGVDEIAKMTAGFSLDGEFGRDDDRPVIRGQANILGNSGVSYFVDGVYISGSLLDYDLDQIERIEIIKGPQSALYGRNTYSGALNIITKSPTDETSGSIKAGFGSFNTKEISAALRGPITDELSGSISARFYDSDGAFTNTVDGSKEGAMQTTSVSGALFWKPSDKLDIRARLHYIKTDDGHQAIINTSGTDNNCYQDNGTYYQGDNRYFCGELMAQPIALDDVRALGEPGYRKREKWQGSVNINYEINENWSIKSITGMNREEGRDAFDGDYQPESYSTTNFFILPSTFVGFSSFTPFGSHIYFTGTSGSNFTSHGGWTTEDYSQELSFDYTSDSIDFRFGGYYLNQDSVFQGTQPFPSGFVDAISESHALQAARMDEYCAGGGNYSFWPCTGAIDGSTFFLFGQPVPYELGIDRSKSDRDLINKALFAHVEFRATEDLTLSVEGRYARETLDLVTYQSNITYDRNGMRVLPRDGGGRINGGTVDPDAGVFKNFTPRFTASYAASDAVNVYATIAKGTKPGGLNSLTAAEVGLGTYDEEEVWAYEGGVKAELLDRQLRLNTAVFRNNVNGYQLTDAYLTAQNTTGTAIQNVGKVRIQGIETELTLAPAAVPGLVINANFAYTDSEIRDTTNPTSGDLLVDSNQETLDNLDDMNMGAFAGDIRGRQLPRQAKYQGYIGFQYSTHLTGDWNLSFGSNLAYESKRYVQVHNLAYMGASKLVGANISFETEELSINFWGKNLTDDDSIIGAFRFVNNAESFLRSFAISPRAGRSFGVTMAKKF